MSQWKIDLGRSRVVKRTPLRFETLPPAKRYLDPAHLVFLIVGDRLAIETGLRTRNVGSVIAC